MGTNAYPRIGRSISVKLPDTKFSFYTRSKRSPVFRAAALRGRMHLKDTLGVQKNASGAKLALPRCRRRDYDGAKNQIDSVDDPAGGPGIRVRRHSSRGRPQPVRQLDPESRQKQFRQVS